jgi:hypothetical protein
MFEMVSETTSIPITELVSASITYFRENESVGE